MNTTRPKPAVAAAGLRKTYGTRTVLDGVDLLVPQGGVFCLLGAAGAGKTTVVRLLSALSVPDCGEVRVAGHDVVREPASVRSAVGFCGLTELDGLLTVEENLLRTADVHRLGQDDGRSRAADLLERFDLVGVAGALAARCSRGERRRLELAMTVVGLPPVLLLDEPTAGLDPGDCHAVRRIIRQLADAGVTVFLATRSRAEAGALADRVAVLHGGRLVADGMPDIEADPRRGEIGATPVRGFGRDFFAGNTAVRCVVSRC
ncbi:ABC transporter ATP-binding protein [Saccharopolyspora erythraea]|uniref:ABC transporter ATP-binding protein n=1 Tax=Saccharopolyspora erythraea TaxID=1836 RepID=UPI001BAE225F|nr:ABC transporter ATP-binding protein [Saccharopolyspora erythraea]QUH03251.1 ABC transporter ATP-binding protein [Saccharopolyspora erythraea]